MKAKNIAILGIGAGALAYGGYKAMQLRRTAGTISIKLADMYGLKHSGNGVFGDLAFTTDLKISNPSEIDLTVSVDSVKILLRGSEIGNTSVNNKAIEVKSKNEQNLKGIQFKIPYQKLATNIVDIITNITKIGAYVKENVSFRIFLTVNGVAIDFPINFNEEKTEKLSGVLELSARERDVRNGASYNHLFPKSLNIHPVIVEDGSVNDTVTTMHKIVNEYHYQCLAIAKMLYVSGNISQTAKNIFDFAYSYLHYTNDSLGKEELRTPSRSWYDGQIRFKQQGIKSAGIDCDDFSIFCGSCLRCLGIPFSFRITKYNGRENFQHVYCFIPATSNNKEIIIDPVVDAYDYEKPYSYKKDFHMNGTISGLPIELLSGTDSEKATELDLYKVVFATDLNGIDELGSVDSDDAMYQYLTRMLKVSKSNKELLKAQYPDPDVFIKMLQFAIDNWHTDKRNAALDKLALIEEKLMKAGVILAIEGLNGEFGELEGFFSSVKKGFKKVAKTAGKGVKKVGKVAEKVYKPVIKQATAVVNIIKRVSPLTAIPRMAILTAIKGNFRGIAKGAAYAYLPEDKALKLVSKSKYESSKKGQAKLKSLLKKVGGSPTELKRAVAQGSKMQLGEADNLGIDPATIVMLLPILKDLFPSNSSNDSKKSDDSALRLQREQQAFERKQEAKKEEAKYELELKKEEAKTESSQQTKKALLIGGGILAAVGVGAIIYNATKPKPQTQVPYAPLRGVDFE